jgi:hypothetical protein
VWNRDLKPNETVKWRGGRKHSRASGKGSEIWQSDKKQTGRYDGKMRDGKKNGHGVNTWANGDRSDGKYRDDKENGDGVYTRADGSRYDGEWRDGEKNGPTFSERFHNATTTL